MERENKSFWNILIWVTVLTGGLFGLQGLMLKVAGKWSLIIYSLILTICSLIQNFRNRKADKPRERDPFGDLLSIATVAGVVFTLVVLDDNLSPFAWWFVPPIVLLASFARYKDNQKRAKNRQEEEERQREPYLVRDREIKSDHKVFILISHAEKERILSRVNSQMFLYTLPDDRFLVLFKEPVSMDVLNLRLYANAFSSFHIYASERSRRFPSMKCSSYMDSHPRTLPTLSMPIDVIPAPQPVKHAPGRPRRTGSFSV